MVVGRGKGLRERVKVTKRHKLPVISLEDVTFSVVTIVNSSVLCVYLKAAEQGP